MGAVQDILSQLDVNQIATALGQSPDDVTAAAEQALGGLLGGVENNLSSADSTRGLVNALGQHIGSPAVGSGSGIDLGQVDFNDGAKIANHLLGAEQQKQLFGGAQGSLIQKLLPLLAPIVMGYLAKRLQGSLTQGGSVDSGLGSILGSVLGGGNSGATGGGSNDALGSILGSVLGGSGGAQGGGLGSVLGSILGGAQSGSPTTTAPGKVPPGGGLGDILGQVLGGVEQTASNSGLTMPDPGAQSGAGASAGGGIGGLLKGILFG